MTTSDLFRYAAIAAATVILFVAPALAQQGPPGCNWKKYLYAQDAVQQGKLDTNMLNQMSALVFRPRLLTDQQGPADLQRLVDGG